MASLVLCLTNDFVWWIPFGQYLVDALPHDHRDWNARAVDLPEKKQSP